MGFYKIKTGTEKKDRKNREKSKGGNNFLTGRQAYQDRHSLRRSKLGRQTEDRVAGILVTKQKQGELISFVKHPAHSPEDMAGKDFTVSMVIHDNKFTFSFGVTISNRQVELSVPLIVIPINMTDERIWYRICQICQKQANAS